MDSVAIIERISLARTKANLSARKLSILLGMNEGYINRLESKKDFLPSLEVLFNIIDVCGLTVEEFFYHDLYSYKQDKEIIDLLKLVIPAKKEAIITLLKTK